MHRYRVFLRDAAYRRIVEIDQYAKLDMVLRFNDVSAFALDLPAGSPAARIASSAHGLIVERDDAVLLSGPIRPQRRTWDERRSTVTIAGFSDTIRLRDRQALPVPETTTPGNYAAREADVRSGRASTVLRAFVDANAGPSAQPRWQVPGLILGPDPLIGASGTWRARFVNLLAHCQSIAAGPPEIGFEIVQEIGGTSLVFRAYAPVDRSDTVVFSPLLGTMRAFGYSIEPPETNYVIVGGGGEGTARVFLEKGDADSIAEWGVIASFRDRRDTSDLAELTQTADEELAQKATRTSLQFSPIDTAMLAFGTHYGLGDRALVVVTDDDSVTDPRLVPIATITDVVREVQITVTAEEGEVVAPTVGTPALVGNGISAVYHRIFKLAGDVSALQRR